MELYGYRIRRQIKGSGFDVAMTDTTDKSRKEAKDSDQAEKKEKTDQKTDTKKEEPAKEDQKEETCLRWI